VDPARRGRAADVDPAAAPQVFYSDCDASTVEWASARLTKRSAAADAQVLEAAGWHERPSLYVICARDETIPPQAQREMAGRATRAVELDAGHFPQLSMPERMAELIASAASELAVSATAG
jgi:pimeloyl-ACP methyl ester carboxylesterase